MEKLPIPHPEAYIYGDYEKAREIYEKAIELYPNNSEFSDNLSLIKKK